MLSSKVLEDTAWVLLLISASLITSAFSGQWRNQTVIRCPKELLFLFNIRHFHPQTTHTHIRELKVTNRNIIRAEQRFPFIITHHRAPHVQGICQVPGGKRWLRQDLSLELITTQQRRQDYAQITYKWKGNNSVTGLSLAPVWACVGGNQ